MKKGKDLHFSLIFRPLCHVQIIHVHSTLVACTWNISMIIDPIFINVLYSKKKLPKLRCIYYLHSYIRNPRHTKETKLHELKSMLYNIVIIISSTRCGYYLLMANVCKISICIVYIFSYILFLKEISRNFTIIYYVYNTKIFLSYRAQLIDHPIIIHFHVLKKDLYQIE